MSLPIFQTQSKELSLMQTSWASKLNPLIDNPPNQGIILNDIDLVAGNNTINHMLGRIPQGWYIVDINGAANVYRSKPLNKLTLTLNSSAPVTVSLEVF